ncbi:cyclic nucleotide-binding domain-containing protein [Thiorhodococcus mannitoliphagus]|uniref:Cyclic nucleotide-binding domain-containing protein n=1 Tax=Thiorhodococcus mannitoliphagus TaxID=329406 RepID=A0A6P1DUG0_9GAMM|nr:cyclic nucleotide-binding domain-containing protein [Thiorhodococcus mannitoliphagus]NEX20823.1 cyclic nucleotide-binding domain-containing protein [Thiorhodococcus mannitoliphagus]
MSDINTKEILAQSALGTELDDQELTTLSERLGLATLAADEDLVREGDERRTLFILAEGRLNVWKKVGIAEEVVYQMRAGECAGTRAFIDGSPRKAGLRAEGPAEVLMLEPEDFEAMIDTHPRIVFKVMRCIFRITHSNLMRMNLESAEMRNYVLRTGGRY